MFELRPISYDHPDAQALTERAQDFYIELYGGPDDDPLTAAEFCSPEGGFLVGYLDDVSVAMGGWTFTEHPLGERVVKIRRMFVDAGVRRQGIARSLLDALEADAVRNGATIAVLATGSPQRAAIAFYRRCGYADIAPFGYYGDSDQVVCLGKELPAAGPTGGQLTSGQPTS